MTAPSSIDPARVVHDQLASASPDLLRQMLTTFVNALMSAEADAVWLEQKTGRPISQTVAAHRWLEEVYDPVVAAIPVELRSRLAPPEILHEILEHRWYISEAAGRDVGTSAAARSYFETVLPAVPQPLTGTAEDNVDAAATI